MPNISDTLGNLTQGFADFKDTVSGFVDAASGKLSVDAVSAAMDNSGRSVMWVAKFVDTDSFPGLAAVMGKVSNALVPIALAFVALFFVLELLDVGFSERFNFEMFVKMVAKLAIAMFLVQNTTSFIEFGGAVANTAGNYLSTIITGFASPETVSSNKDLAIEFCNSWNEGDHNIFDTEIAMLGLTLAGGAGKIVSLFVLTVLISRQFEIISRGCFMSIAFAFLAESQNRQAAIRYIKQFVALYLQAPAILICFGLYALVTATCTSAIATAMVTSGDLLGLILGICATPLCCGFGLLGAIKSTKPICEAAMGV